MNASQLLSHFDRISAAPDAIPRLRRFILDLAVRGKLVEQDPKDEPAAKLLKRIQAAKVRLVKAGRIKESQPLTALAGTKAPYEIPSNWGWVPLGETVNSHLGGGTPSKNNSSYWDGDIFWASVKDVGKGKYIEETIDRITKAGLADSSSNLIPPGNLIIVTRMGLGKLSINRVSIAINQDLRALSLSSLSVIDYHYIFFKTHGFAGTGLTVKGIRVGELLNIAFPLPPLAEQHRIVSKVDELMVLCDRLEETQAERENRRDRLSAASLNRLNQPVDDPSVFQESARFYFNHLPRLTSRPEHIQQLRQTILNLAVRGKLVPQLDTVEVGYLSEMPATQHETTDCRDDSEPEIDMHSSAPPFPSPYGWKWSRVRDVLMTRQGVQIPKEQQLSKAKPGYKRYLYISDFRHDDKLKFVLDQFPAKEVTEEDLVMANTAGPGEVFRGVTGILSNNLFKITFDRLLFTQNYLFIYFTSPIFVAAVDAELKGGAQQHLGHKLMGKQFVAIPPLAEQHRIVAKVDELMALCDKLEVQLTTTQTESRRLLAAVLHEALAKAS